MCEPLTIAAGALAAGSVVAGEISKSKQSAAVKDNALRALKIDFNALSARQDEEEQLASQQIRAGARQADSAAGTTLAQAAGVNVGGLSVRALIQEIEADRAGFSEDIRTNTKLRVGQLEREKRSVRAAANARIAGAPGGSFLSGALQIAGIGVSTANSIIKGRP